jgi:hypothetical protein
MNVLPGGPDNQARRSIFGIGFPKSAKPGPAVVRLGTGLTSPGYGRELRRAYGAPGPSRDPLLRRPPTARARWRTSAG